MTGVGDTGLRVSRFVGGARGRRGPAPKPLAREASSVIDGLIGDDEVVREVERVRRLETAHDLVRPCPATINHAGHCTLWLGFRGPSISGCARNVACIALGRDGVCDGV